MPVFSLFTPLPGLPWYLLPIWPLIFWRIQRLKAWFKANGHPGAQMLWGVMKSGRVILIRASDSLSVQPKCTFRAPVSDRLALALDAEQAPCPRRMPGPQAIPCSHPGLRCAYGLTGPIPDT